jgi:hypothetical protein
MDKFWIRGAKKTNNYFIVVLNEMLTQYVHALIYAFSYVRSFQS